MDFSLNEEQRAWQMKARQFAHDEIRPLSLPRDRISDPRRTFDWTHLAGSTLLQIKSIIDLAK